MLFLSGCLPDPAHPGDPNQPGLPAAAHPNAPPDPAEIAKRVKKIVAEQLEVEESKVTPDARFVDDLGADHLDLVELTMAFEEAFDLEIPDKDAEGLRTVRDATDYIVKRLTPPPEHPDGKPALLRLLQGEMQ